MKNQEMFYKPPRKMIQPTKDELRTQLENLTQALIDARTPIWVRILRRLL